MTNKIWQTLQKHDLSQSAMLSCLIQEADALVIGIGAGMSAADGFTYIGERFTSNFPDFIEKYQLLDMLQASLFEFESTPEYWAFQSRFIALNYLDQPVGQTYLDLKEMIEKKPYHIITTNADNAFDAAGYDKEKVFHIQGEYGLLQCSRHCHQQTYRDDERIRQMIAQQTNMEVPYELIPTCPKCDAFMEVNKRDADSGMVEDDDFHAQEKRYQQFLAEHSTGKVLYIEIGVGYTTPQYIKHPFHKRTRENPSALFIAINQKNYRVPRDIEERSLLFNEHIAPLIQTAHHLSKIN